VYYTRRRRVCPEESERNRKLATLLFPTGYDGLNVILCKRVGHIEPVSTNVNTGIPIGHPGQSAPIVFDGGQEAGELAGQVNRFLHVCIIPHSWGIARGKGEKNKKKILLAST
jgi:hypothetical protein